MTTEPTAQEELKAMRIQLLERMATEVYGLNGPYEDERLGKIARILAGIQAIDLILDQEIDRPEGREPDIFFCRIACRLMAQR